MIDLDRMLSNHRLAIRQALTLAALLMASGCGDAPLDPERGGTPSPSWLAQLPPRSIEAAAGETVWAVVPEAGSEAATVGSYRLEAASGTTAVLVDSLGNRFADVPGALVHAASRFPEVEMASGTVVLADRWDADKVVGRVATPDDGALRVAYDWNGVTETGTMDAVLALPTLGESFALRWVAYQADAAWYKGLCVAESDERLWLSDDSGHVVIVARDAVKALDDLGRSELAAGADVSAYSWGYGYQAGKIVEVLEPGLRYAVELEGGETRAFFFENLTQVL